MDLYLENALGIAELRPVYGVFVLTVAYNGAKSMENAHTNLEGL